MTDGAIEDVGAGAAAGPAGGFRVAASAASAAAVGAGALAVAAAVALWASEGARVFVEMAFSAMLACL